MTTGEKEWHHFIIWGKENEEDWIGVVFGGKEKGHLKTHVEKVPFGSRSQAFIHKFLSPKEETWDQYFRDAAASLNIWAPSCSDGVPVLAQPHSPGQCPLVSSCKNIQGSFPFSSKENTSGW